MYKPEFPYKGNQLILSSERVLVHAKSDAIFLFGKQAVSLSSTKTINLDAVDKVLIDCKVIELGAKAQTLGQPVVLGRNLNTQLALLLKEIAYAGTLMAQASETDLGASMQLIANAGQIINKEASRLSQVLNSGFILSKNTFTR
jgi:hypothetical protein